MNIGVISWTIVGVIKGDARGSDYSSYRAGCCVSVVDGSNPHQLALKQAGCFSHSHFHVWV